LDLGRSGYNLKSGTVFVCDMNGLRQGMDTTQHPPSPASRARAVLPSNVQAVSPAVSYVHMHRPRLCSAGGSTHTESNKLYRKVKHRSPPKSILTPTAKSRPVRRRSRRLQGRRAPHTEHGLGVLLALAQHISHSHSGIDEKRPTEKFVQG